MNDLDKDIKDLKVLISEEEIQAKLKTLAKEIESIPSRKGSRSCTCFR